MVRAEVVVVFIEGYPGGMVSINFIESLAVHIRLFIEKYRLFLINGRTIVFINFLSFFYPFDSDLAYYLI